VREALSHDGVSYAEVYLDGLTIDEYGYIEEFENIGFDIEKFIEMDVSTAIPHSASIYIRKGK
jgi:hypothetical protein